MIEMLRVMMMRTGQIKLLVINLSTVHWHDSNPHDAPLEGIRETQADGINPNSRQWLMDPVKRMYSIWQLQ